MRTASRIGPAALELGASRLDFLPSVAAIDRLGCGNMTEMGLDYSVCSYINAGRPGLSTSSWNAVEAD